MSYAKSLSLPLVVLALLATSSIAQTDKLPDITNTRVHSPTVASSGQPSKGQFEDISRSGVEVVINLAPKYLPDSIRNERKLVRSEGMEYFFIPVDWDRPSQNDVDKFLTAMDKVRGKRVLVHCWINARASAFVYLYRVLREGASQDEEYKILEELWDYGKDQGQGYELKNVPHWRKLLTVALERHQ